MAEKTSTQTFGINPKKLTVNWFNRNGISMLVVAGILVLWEIYSRFFNEIGDIYFPSIAFTVEQTLRNSDRIIAATQLTFSEVFMGFIMGVTIGVAIGIIYAESFVLRQASMPMLVFMYSLPFAIVAPVFIIWFGTGLFSIGLFVALFSFYPVFINTITGFTHVEQEFYHLGDVFGASRYQFIKEIKFWEAFPHVIGGIKIAVQQSVVGAIVAEFIASGGGLGNLILVAAQTQQLGMMFGVLALIMLVAIVYFKVVGFLMDYALPGPSNVE
ncbi:MAG: ABC transporter permease [Halobacteriota archaeon]